MNVIKTYDTNSKWSFSLNESGLPVDSYRWVDTNTVISAGQNVLLFGCLKVADISRGRSAVKFNFKAIDENSKTVSLPAKNTNLLMKLIISKDMDSFVSDDEHFVEGFWTVSKQGETISLLPLSKEDAKSIMD